MKTADPFFSTGACSGGVCGATQVSFTYNALGQRATMTDASGITTYTYDGNNRLQHKVTPEGGLNYSYDAVGDITETFADNWNSGGVDTRYAYDVLARTHRCDRTRRQASRDVVTKLAWSRHREGESP